MTSRSSRRVRRPPRTARHEGRRITRRHGPKTVSAGERKQQRECHYGLAGPLPPVVGGAVWCLRLRLELNEDFPKNDAESRRATMVAQAAPTQQATGRDACAHALGRSRWTMSVTAADGTFAVVGNVESARHVCQPWWCGTAGHALKNRCICDVQGVVEPSHARLRFAWETEPYPVARGEVIPRMAWIYASGRDAERAEAANACRWALCSASFPGRVTPCA